jgi:CBS domain-containing protein
MVDAVPPVHETLAEITGFLGTHPPFSDLDSEALSVLAGHAEIEYFPAGAQILAQEGFPSEYVYVVRTGAVELLDEGQVIDILEDGEVFGHASLLSRLPPSFTARAHEDTLCYLFASEPAEALLSDAEGVRFVAATLHSRLSQATARTRRATPWGTAHIGARTRPALVASPGDSIREVAQRMTAGGHGVAVVTVGSEFALVTDRDLRERVVAGNVSADDPIVSLGTTPSRSVSPDRLALEALVDMLEADVEGLVVVDEGGRLVGVVDQSALLEIDSPSPLLLRQRVLRATHPEEVASALEDLPRLALRLLDASVEALDVLDVLTTATDAATRRLTELAVADLGKPPVPWAWLTLGSAARREQTLATDQDNGIAFEGSGTEVDAYFEAFARLMNDSLARCGYARCRAAVMAENPGWRLSRQGWIELFESWLRMPTSRNVQLAMIGFDVRSEIGPLDMERDLEDVLETASRRQDFLDALARSAVANRPPLGFLRGLVVDRSGQHVGTLDVKTGGILPIVNLARLYALSVGSTTKRTVQRLRAAAAHGRVSTETAQELEEAFATLSRIRLEHQAAQVERGASPDNHVDPREVPPLERRQLKEAFRAIARAQHAVDARTATRIP